MKRIRTILRTCGMVAVLGLATLALPLPAHAGGVHIDIGLPLLLPFPIFVAPAPIFVAPPPEVVYPAPVVVSPEDYGYYGYRPGYWRHPYHVHNGYGGYRQGGWQRSQHLHNDPGGYPQGGWRPHR